MRGRGRDSKVGFSRGSGRGGGFTPRGRGNHSTTPPKPSKVPAFPVVSRTPSAAPAERAYPKHQAQYHGSADDEAPPAAVSARRGREDEDNDFPAVAHPSTVRGRGGAGRGGDSRRGRGFCRGGAPTARRATEADDATATLQQQKPTHVVTTVTADGTELPKRLNNKVFIDGLPYSYDEPGKPSLEDEVMQFATAWKVGKPLRLIKRPGQGFGFLVFNSPHSVPTAVRVLNGRKFLGRALRVEEPKPRDMERLMDVAGMKDIGKSSFQRQVLLTDLAKVSQPEIICEVLRDVAPQLEKKLETIKMTSKNRKAFLTFEDDADVDPAVTFLDGFHLLGRRIGAARAAAPGSTPYSRVPAPSTSRFGSSGASATSRFGSSGAPATSNSGGHATEAEEEETVVPLGVEATAAKASLKKATRIVQASNVTGKTEKYNLLDDGAANIFVGNLSDHITSEQLRDHLSPAGKILECELIVHPETHLSTGIAHVRYALPAYAAYAQQRFHGSRLRGCVLRVDRGGESSVPLASEQPAAAEEEDDYDEDAFIAKRYGVKDKKAFFKGTSLAKEVGAGCDDETDEEVKKMPTRCKKSVRTESQSVKGSATKRTKKEAAPSKKARILNCTIGADMDADDDDGADFVFGGKVPLAGADADDSDDEHFFDVDDVHVPSANKKGGASSAKKGWTPVAPKLRKGKKGKK